MHDNFTASSWVHLQLHQNRVNAAGPFSVRIFVYSLAEKCPDVTITISNGQLCILKCIDCKSYCHTFDLAASHAAFTTAIVHLLFQITLDASGWIIIHLPAIISNPWNAVKSRVSAIQPQNGDKCSPCESATVTFSESILFFSAWYSQLNPSIMLIRLLKMRYEVAYFQ